MNKVAQRLRDRNIPYGWIELADKVADEIERLQAEVQELNSCILAWQKTDKAQKDEIERLNRVVIRGLAGVELSEENDRLIAEIERLRAALEFYADATTAVDEDGGRRALVTLGYEKIGGKWMKGGVRR